MTAKILPWLIFAVLLIGSCARQSSPTGGPKDTIPPILERSSPQSNQLRYKGKTIELSFSEMIILNNPKEQIIITPTAGPFDIKSKNKRVVLQFEDPLKDSTTYSLNFRDAIKDITEKNPAPNLQLAFSTGPYIDSLSISGNVYDLVKGTIPKEATVAIYEYNDTLSIFKHKPSYLTKTDPKGKFKLPNLKPGNYFVYAIEDKNRNLIVDSKSEYYGFLAKPITLEKDTQNIQLGIIKLDARTLKLTSYRPYNNYFNIKTSKNISDYTLSTIPPGDTLISCFGEDASNVRLYNTFSTDSTLVRFTATDSIGNKLDTTLYAKFNTRETTPEKISVNADNIIFFADRGQLDIGIKFNKPTLLANTDSLLFQLDSAHIIPLKTGSFKWDTQRNKLDISVKISPNLIPKKDDTKSQAAPSKTNKAKVKTSPENTLIIGRATFVSIDQDTIAKISKTIKPTKTEELGVILVTIQTNQPHFIAELLNKDLKTVASSLNTKQIRWESLPPGDYKIRVIIDSNGNGQWDPGNYFLKEEPESIIYYLNEKTKPENTTHVKANWEVGPLLIKY